MVNATARSNHMTHLKPSAAITYIGNENPFVDRVYNSRLTFTHGQSRVVPEPLASKFLAHADSFQRSDAAQAVQAVATQELEVNSTSAQLDEAARKDAERRQKENSRFELHQQFDKMDKKALRDWAKVHFKQDLHHNLSESNVREQVKGLVDQFGAP